MKLTVNKDIISRVFVAASFSLIVSQIVLFLASFIDSIITSQFLSVEAYSAIALLSPSLNILNMLTGMIAGGGQIMYSRYLGKGQKRNADTTFSLCVIMGIIVTLIYIGGYLLFKKEIFFISGITVNNFSEIYYNMEGYLYGYLFGVPAFVFVIILSPIIIIDNNKYLVTLSSLFMCICNITGDLISIFVFKAGIFGIGLVTAFSATIQVVILLFHFTTKKCKTRFSINCLKSETIRLILKGGSPDLIRRLSNIMRNFIMNDVNLSVALSTSAIAARGIQNDINSLMFAFSNGFSKTMVSITSIYYGAKDVNSLKKLYICSMRTIFITSIIIGLTFIIFAKQISGLYGNDPELIYYASFGIRCMAVVLIFDMFASIMQGYLQGISRIRAVNIYCFFERFLIPTSITIILGLIYGTLGVLASLAIGKVVQVAIIFLIIVFTNKRMPRSISDLLMLDDELLTNDDKSFDISISSFSDIFKVCDEVENFCINNKFPMSMNWKLRLIIEEISKNIINHGNTSKNMIDMRIFIFENNITLTIRDNAKSFDLVEYYNKHKTNKNLKSNGLKIVFGFAKEVKYISSFNTNNVIILL